VARAIALTPENIQYYMREVQGPVMEACRAAHQEIGSKLTLEFVLNFDEYYLDLNEFARSGERTSFIRLTATCRTHSARMRTCILHL
jgi:hypothetical protein